jgi:hypothetical protein
MSSHYEVLGVRPDADPDTVRRAYLRAARASHPDTGGDAGTFAAVAGAWEVLSSPPARARYDAELAASDLDTDPGWGDETEYGAPAPPPTAAPAPSPGPPRPDQAPPGPRDRVDPHRPPDPFRSPPLSLPSTDPPRPARRWNVRLVVVGCIVAAQLLRAVHPLPDLGTLPDAVAAPLTCVPLWLLVLLARTAQQGRRGLGSVVLWGSVGLTAGVCVVGADGTNHTSRLVELLVGGLVTAAWAWACWRFARWRNRVRDREGRQARLALAHTWNAVLDAAQWPGTRIVQAAGSADRDGLVQVNDPVTGEHARLRLDRTMCGRWLLLRGSTVVAHAPAQAPEAWADLLAGAAAR